MAIDSDGCTVSKEAVETRIASLEASKAARAARVQVREVERQRATAARTANTVEAMAAVSLKTRDQDATPSARYGEQSLSQGTDQ
jgi:hypothetical protein